MGEAERDGDAGTYTDLLRASKDGDRNAYEELFRRTEGELRRVAQRVIHDGMWPRSGIQGTELLNMACERLLQGERLMAEDRRHFFFLLGRAMRDVLVEEHRRQSAQKRGGGRAAIPLHEIVVEGETFCADRRDLRAALEALETQHPESADVVRMLFEEGLSLREAARLRGCSLAAVRKHWEYARTWLAARAE